jgi:glycosyltransferase involved in cell wall biosynthesis
VAEQLPFFEGEQFAPAISDMKISILLPVFNAAPYLEECLESILTQSLQDWELIAVDDFSTDSSPAVLAAYAASDPRIRVVKNNSKGIAPALNLAYQLSTGELITRMDSDDRMAPGKLQSLRSLLLKYGKRHVSTGLVRYFSSEGAVGNGYLQYAEWLNRLALESRHYQEIYRECTVPSPCWMAWRGDLEHCRAFAEVIYPEDYDLIFRFRAAGMKVVAVPEVLHEWRDHARRSSRNLEQYRDNSFLDLKTAWFIKSDYDPGRTLVLWGAGRKGKQLAGLLGMRQTPFRWICNNPDKWGREIAGAVPESIQVIEALEAPQVIIAVAAKDAQEDLQRLLEKKRLLPGRDYFFFC